MCNSIPSTDSLEFYEKYKWIARDIVSKVLAQYPFALRFNDDLTQEALLGIVLAANKYNPSFNVKPETFFYYCVSGALKRYLFGKLGRSGRYELNDCDINVRAREEVYSKPISHHTCQVFGILSRIRDFLGEQDYTLFAMVNGLYPFTERIPLCEIKKKYSDYFPRRRQATKGVDNHYLNMRHHKIQRILQSFINRPDVLKGDGCE